MVRSHQLFPAILVALAVAVPAVPLSSGVATDVASAAEPKTFCPKKAGGLERENAYGEELDWHSSYIDCVYARSKPTHRSFSVSVVWHDQSATSADLAEMETLFCDAGPEGERLRPYVGDGSSGIDLSRLGETRIFAVYRYSSKKEAGAAKKLARNVLKRQEGRATQCGGAASDASGAGASAGSSGPVAGGRAVQLILSGDRLTAMRAAGGVGATVPLVGDERYGLVLRDAEDDSPVAEEDYLGSVGRVVDIGTVLTDEAGNDLVSVTVEILPDGATAPATGGAADGSSPAGDDSAGNGDVDDVPSDEPIPTPDDGSHETVSDPDPDDGTGGGELGDRAGAAEDDSDTGGDPTAERDRPAASDRAASVEPIGRTGPEDDEAETGRASAAPATLEERLAADLDRIERDGSGPVIIASDEIEAIAAESNVARAVEAKNGYLSAIPNDRKLKRGRVHLYPELDAATDTIYVRVAASVRGLEMFEQTVARVRLEDVPSGFAGGTVDRIVQTYRDARARGLRPVGVIVSPDGVGVQFEAGP